MLQIGSGKDVRKEHHCPLCVGRVGGGAEGGYIPKHDNAPQNIVVIHTGGDGPGLGYNKYSYLEAVAATEGKDPTTRKSVSVGKRREILESGYFDVVEV
jgi:hypothetical protein